MKTVPVIFHYNSKPYVGFFEPLTGAASGLGDTWYLMINNYYHGSLHFSQHAGHFLFQGNSFNEMGDYFEASMTAWFA